MLPNKFLHEWVPPCIACRNGKLRCGYSPDLLAILQGNPGCATPDFASVATQKVHIEYDLVGYIPVDELLKAEQA